MKAMILRDDPEASVACAKVLLEKGFQVICLETRHIARALLRVETIDILVMDERVDGRLTHSVALSAERRLPYISTIMMTDRPGEEADDLFELIPSLYSLMGCETPPDLLAKMAMASMENFEEIQARVNRNAALDEEELTMGPDPIWEDDTLEDEDNVEDEAQIIAEVFGPVMPQTSVAQLSDPQLDMDDQPPEEDVPSYVHAMWIDPDEGTQDEGTRETSEVLQAAKEIAAKRFVTTVSDPATQANRESSRMEIRAR